MNQSLNLVFCGTPRFAVPTLNRLVEVGFQVALVVTLPDKPRGRGLELSPPPVKNRAIELGLPVMQPEKIKNNEGFRARLAALKPAAIVVVGYGRLIPQWMISLPPLGNINLHASLLPKYRGAAPIQWAIACGETVTGVTTMRIDAKKEDGLINFSRSAIEICNRLRGFQPWPGAFTSFRGKNLRVWAARPAATVLPPGDMKVDGDRLMVGCGQGASVEILELQPEGKKRMSARDFIHGYHPNTGEKLG